MRQNRENHEVCKFGFSAVLGCPKRQSAKGTHRKEVMLALRHYPAPQGQIAYKTLFPSNKRPYPNLPRLTPPPLASKGWVRKKVSSVAETVRQGK